MYAYILCIFLGCSDVGNDGLHGLLMSTSAQLRPQLGLHSIRRHTSRSTLWRRTFQERVSQGQAGYQSANVPKRG